MPEEYDPQEISQKIRKITRDLLDFNAKKAAQPQPVTLSPDETQWFMSSVFELVKYLAMMHAFVDSMARTVLGPDPDMN